MHAPDLEVAAEQGTGIGQQARLRCGAETADGADGENAEKQAGEKDPEAAQSATQFAARKAQGLQQNRGRCHRCSP